MKSETVVLFVFPYQVLFSIESGDPCEEALKKLAERGIGLLLNSVVRYLLFSTYLI